MERLTIETCGEILVKNGDGEHRSPCFGCESINECKSEKMTCGFYKAIKKLKEYEDLEEQGLLLETQCTIGSDVYYIPSKANYKLNILDGHKEHNRVYSQKVARIVFTERGWYLECDKDVEYGTDRILVDKLYKETWFLSYDEAEEALKGMEENNETG